MNSGISRPVVKALAVFEIRYKIDCLSLLSGMHMSKQTKVRYIWVVLGAVLIAAAAWGAETGGAVGEGPAETGIASEGSPNPADLFDPSRHIDVKDVKAGMRGYGLTVFHGSQIEPFDIEVVSVVHNSQPRRDIILIRCLDERFQKAKVVQGVSGSPVFLNGKMAGAMAFGWALSEEPLYGVTPIRQMLQIQRVFAGDAAAKAASMEGTALPRELYRDLMRDVLIDEPHWRRLVELSGLSSAGAGDAETGSGFIPLPLPMTLNGISPQAVQAIQKRIPTLNILPGGPAVSTAAGDTAGEGTSGSEPVLAPGSVMTIPLITGDFDGSILGTATEVIGNQVYGFGHPWNGRGPSHWPLASGTIHTFVSRMTLSFKLGQSSRILGTVCADESTGLCGRIGEAPKMIPVEVKIAWPYANSSQEFHLKIASDEKINPLLLGVITQEVFSYKGNMPVRHTIHYRMELEFDGIEPIRFENVSTGDDLIDIFDDLVSPLMLLLNNPWQKIHLTGVKISATVTDHETSAVIKSSRIDQQYYKPGQTVTVQLELEPLRNSTRMYELQLPLPEDLPDGRYQIEFGAAEVYSGQLRRTQPHLFQAFNAVDVRNVLQRRLDVGRGKLYICMTLPQNNGLALEEQAFPQLPSGKSMLLNDKIRKKTAMSFRSMIYRELPIDLTPIGAETFDITVQRHPD
jgi:hypothetical protein